jgi:protease I
MELQLSRILNFLQAAPVKTGAGLIYTLNINCNYLKGLYKMANDNLKGKKVAILVTDGFEQDELLKPREALDKAGAETKVVSLKKGPLKGWDMTKWGKEVPADLTLDNARPDGFDALLLPGGVINPDKLRMEPKAVAFVKSIL